MQSKHLPDFDHVSALADGALSGEAFTAAAQATLSDPQAVQRWHTYHLIGDVLRGDAGGVSKDGGMGFWHRLEARLETEPVGVLDSLQSAEIADPVANSARGSSANKAVFRWRLIAGVTSVGLAGVLGWGVWSQSTLAHSLSGQNTLAVSQPPGVMLRDPVLDDLLADHQRLGGYSALQVPTGFLRTAIYEAPAK